MENQQFEQAMNLNVQQYKGQDYLTFWTKKKKTSHSKHSKKSYVLVWFHSPASEFAKYITDVFSLTLLTRSLIGYTRRVLVSKETLMNFASLHKVPRS
jgi:hypothetical protein